MFAVSKISFIDKQKIRQSFHIKIAKHRNIVFLLANKLKCEVQAI